MEISFGVINVIGPLNARLLWSLSKQWQTKLIYILRTYRKSVPNQVGLHANQTSKCYVNLLLRSIYYLSKRSVEDILSDTLPSTSKGLYKKEWKLFREYSELDEGCLSH